MYKIGEGDGGLQTGNHEKLILNIQQTYNIVNIFFSPIISTLSPSPPSIFNYILFISMLRFIASFEPGQGSLQDLYDGVTTTMTIRLTNQCIQLTL